ncbi:hypothetical protein WHK03_14485, partial [Staphylococcus aureus]|uniref:hypothetical protein n=1 Tax=Staphylococcus aureus TaxID=1280 RepID=UPI0039BE9706
MPAHAPADTGSVCIYGKTYPGDIASADALAPLLGRTSVVFAKGMAVIVDDMRFEQHAFDALDGSAGLTPVDDYVYWA